MTSSSRAGTDLDGEVAQRSADVPTTASLHVGAILSDAPREGQHVEPAQRGRDLPDGASNAVREDAEPEWIVEPARARRARTRARGRGRARRRTGRALAGDRGGARVDGARARRHRHAFERGEAHAGVDRATATDAPSRNSLRPDGTRRGARPPPARRPTARRARGSRTSGCPSPRASCRGTAYVAACSGIDAWKAVSKTATCRSLGAPLARRESPAGPARLWSGASGIEAPRSRQHLVIDADRLAERRHRRGRRGGRPHPQARTNPRPPRLVVRHQVTLQARRAGVDGEDRPIRCCTSRSIFA